jgi:hypothetical protein
VSFVVQGFVFPMSAMSRDYGDPGDSYGPLPVSLSQKPHPPGTFVENKGQTRIRQDSHKAVDALFSRFSKLQSDPISA